MPEAIFGPFLALALLTLVVWFVMYVRRIRYVIDYRVRPQDLSTPESVARLIPDSVQAPANNLKNLFELPVLFYALALYLYVTGSVDWVYVAAAWAFVAARAAHSYVQCTSNHVMTRFRVYVAGAVLLWLMLLRAIVEFIVACTQA